MNKTYTYGIVALALVVIVGLGASAVFKGQTHVANSIATVVEGTQNSAAAAMAVKIGESQNITWDQTKFSSANVSVTLIKKVSDSPARYDVVRVLSASTPNTGSIAWTPTAEELGGDVYTQVGCVAATSACRSTISTAPITVTK